MGRIGTARFNVVAYNASLQKCGNCRFWQRLKRCERLEKSSGRDTESSPACQSWEEVEK